VNPLKTEIVKTQQICRFLVAIIFLATVVMPPAAQAGLPFKWPTAASDKAKQKKQQKTPDADDSDNSKDQAAPAKSDQPADSSASTTAAPPTKTGPYSPEAVKHYNRAVELHQSGFLNQAIDEYKEALASDPRIEQAWSNLGGIYAAQRNYTKAIDALQKALDIKPDRPTTLNALATVLYARGKIEDAKQKWSQAVQIEPNFAAAYYNMGNALESEKRPGEAISSYAKAIEVNPAMADAYYRIGALYFKQKHYAQSQILLNKAVKIAPTGDFVKEAKKDLASISTDLSSESHSSAGNRDLVNRDVKMNVVAPQSATEPEAPKAAAKNPDSAAAPKAAQTPIPTADESAASPGGDEDTSGKKHKSKHKSKDHTHMFITQPPDGTVSSTTSNNGSTDQDLQEKPAQ
jgi:tetratricopeptide (TPR) repeat protein